MGQVVKFASTEEVVLELRSNANVPTDVSTGYSVDFVWKSTSFDRMQVTGPRSPENGRTTQNRSAVGA